MFDPDSVGDMLDSDSVQKVHRVRSPGLNRGLVGPVNLVRASTFFIPMEPVKKIQEIYSHLLGFFQTILSISLSRKS